MPDRPTTSRANGAISHGPTTPEGKVTSSRNALRHGLSANKLVLPSESQPAYRKLLQDYFDHFKPTTGVERELVYTMALARWRLRRLSTIEVNMYSNQLFTCREQIRKDLPNPDPQEALAWAFKFLGNNSTGFAMMLRYESTLTRTHDRAFKQVEAVRAKKQNEPTVLPAQSNATPTT